ncbi:MAG: alpha/beta hydrolase [Pseudomonadota bacterium]
MKPPVHPSDWDRQFKLSAIIPDFQQCLDRKASEGASHSLPLNRIAYGPDDRQWVETGAGTGPADKAALFFHGGCWRTLDAATRRFVPPGLSRSGRCNANAEYRLIPSAQMADVVADAVAAARAVLESAGASRLVLAGHSAGAHLALSALQDAEVRAAADGAILVSGVYDLAPNGQSFLQDELALTSAEITAHSFERIPSGVPSLLPNGEDEATVFR